MTVSIVCVGKLKEKYLKDAIDEYRKRLSRFCKLEITEIPDEKTPDNASQAEEQQILLREGRKILSAIKEGTPIIAMCVEGTLVSSEELSEKLSALAMNSGRVAFIIGGSLGLSDEVKSKAISKISFGRITLPHQLMRVVLSEQIYRSFKIANNESYHK
ncbi:MAG: 23S rRNA (pseudouridine(1915)-N(3))-methyltransferase RlmH [Eubacteriales bacterium]|nr:23S rRNA (pseudouridine(1915)-N(3))-methyltransferase RlmH [Eubacteriales bacterium]